MVEQTVSRDKISRFPVSPQNIRLHPGKPAGTVRHEPVIVQQIGWIVAVIQHRTGRKNLVPIRIRLAPYYRSPRLIQGSQCDILLLQKAPESNLVRLRVELIRLAVDFVVDLPAHHARVLSVLPCHLFHNSRAEFLIDGRIIVVMPSAPMSVRRTLTVAIQRFRVFLGEPCRRRRGGRSQNDIHPRLDTKLHKFIKQLKAEDPF